MVGRAAKGRGVFGLTLSKILLTILVALALWKGLAMVGRLTRERQAKAVQGQRRARERGRGTIELIECTRCGAYFDPAQGCRCGQRRS